MGAKPVAEERYHYSVAWSDEDDAYVARVAEWPLLAAHGETMHDALDEILCVVGDAIDDMNENGEDLPEPLAPNAACV